MKLFGRHITFQWPVKAVAPSLPPRRADGALTEILPPFSTNPPITSGSAVQQDVAERSIHNDPRELWYLSLPSKLSPQQVLMILRSALGGDLWQQWQLLSLMLDSWPMLRKCAHEIRQAVSAVRFSVHPYAEQGEEPTPSAKEKADLVGRALRQFRPDPFTDERGFSGMVYDLTDMVLNGLTVSEVVWRYTAVGEWLPRAAAWVHPRHFTFGNDGRLAIFDDLYKRLGYGTAQRPGEGPDPNKFLCAQFMSRSGSSLGAGLMRPLAWYWSAAVFNREWMLKFAQRYGNPFLDATYRPGTPDAEVNAISSFLAKAGSQGYINRPEGSTLNVVPAQSLGTDNPQVAIMRQADEACQILLLGQTATTQGTPGKLGGETAHESVKRENVEGVAKQVGTILTEQLAPAALRLNWGDEEECPTVEPDFTESVDPLDQATRDKVFLDAQVPMLLEEFYKRNQMAIPETGDKVLLGGRIGLLADTEEEVGGKPEPPQVPQGVPEGQNGEPGGSGDALSGLRKALSKATDGEISRLRELVVQASRVEEVNGEWEEVELMVENLRGRGRKVFA